MPEPPPTEETSSPIRIAVQTLVGMMIRIGFVLGFLQCVATGAMFAAIVLGATILTIAVNDSKGGAAWK